MPVRVRGGLKISLLLALLVHACFVLFFVFTFSVPSAPAKPLLVFLGSFLRQEDVMPSAVRSDMTATFDIRRLNLDSRDSSWPNGIVKPSLTQKAVPSVKTQFKPVVTQAIAPPKSKPVDARDLGIDLEPLPPVKMKINQND